tara:strand:+ start:8146 stop:8670 length:525 start_codon:yes stop_codon:yes gene_type:complete
MNFSKIGRRGLSSLFPKDAIGVELGVAQGHFSDALLASNNVQRLFSIDRWLDHHNDSEYVKACKLLAKHKTRSIVMRSSFSDVLCLFPESYFDFIYIDAYAHTGQEDGTILHEWYPKLKIGGIFSGHDYDNRSWPKTVKAVDSFANSVGKNIEVIPGVDTTKWQDRYPSWYFIK